MYRPRDPDHAFEQACIALGHHVVIDYLETLIEANKPAPLA